VRCELCRTSVEPKKGKCPRCGARLDWSTRTPPPRASGAARPFSRTTLLWVGIGVLVVVGAAWHIWFGQPASDRFSADGAAKKSSSQTAAECEALSTKLLGGKSLSSTDLELFKTTCVARDRK